MPASEPAVSGQLCRSVIRDWSLYFFSPKVPSPLTDATVKQRSQGETGVRHKGKQQVRSEIVKDTQASARRQRQAHIASFPFVSSPTLLGLLRCEGDCAACIAFSSASQSHQGAQSHLCPVAGQRASQGAVQMYTLSQCVAGCESQMRVLTILDNNYMRMS